MFDCRIIAGEVRFYPQFYGALINAVQRRPIVVASQVTSRARMNSGNKKIEVNGIHLTEGTSLYDTEHNRVLWISNIDDTGVTVEPVDEYTVDKPTGWPPANKNQTIAEGTVFSIHDLKSLLKDGRFEISP